MSDSTSLKPFDGTTDFSIWKVKMKALLTKEKCLSAVSEEWHADTSAERKKELQDQALDEIMMRLSDDIIRHADTALVLNLLHTHDNECNFMANLTSSCKPLGTLDSVTNLSQIGDAVSFNQKIQQEKEVICDKNQLPFAESEVSGEQRESSPKSGCACTPLELSELCRCR